MIACEMDAIADAKIQSKIVQHAQQRAVTDQE